MNLVYKYFVKICKDFKNFFIVLKLSYRRKKKWEELRKI